MKKLVLLLACALRVVAGSAQTASDCTPIPALQKLYRDDAADMALERIFSLKLADTASIEIPQPFQDSAMRELAAVCNLNAQLEADSVFRAYCVHRSDQRRFMPAQLALQVDTSEAWAKQWFRGNKLTGNAAIDGFLSRHGVEMTHYQYNPSWSAALNHIATLSASRPINTKAFADSMMKFRGTVQWYFRPRYGDGSQIVYSKGATTQLSFVAGWGDCPLGCTGTKTWRYTVDPATCSVSLDTIFFQGKPRPAALPNCNLAPVSVPAQTAATAIVVAPNPATSELHVSGASPSAAYRIFDLSGRLLLHGTLGAGKVQVADLQPGMYLLAISTSDGTRFAQPFAKQ